MELALGTVQFGLAYGIAGRGEAVPGREAAAILACAADHGVRVLDTASAYGDAEERLRSLMGPHRFEVVTKLRPCPGGLDVRELATWARGELVRSRERLGDAVRGLLFHRAEDLLDAHAEALWDECSTFAQREGWRLGVSAYEPETVARVHARYPVALAQLPGNAFDQRVAQRPSGVEVHLRSAFLQGLLLLPEEQGARKLPPAAPALVRWHAWCARHRLAPLEAALGIVKGFAGVTHCVVGVESVAQFEEIAAAWHAAPVLTAPELAVDDAAVVDPREWKSA